MVDNIRKVVKVFLASPSDLQEERSLAKATVDEFNETIGRFLGYHIDLVGWEDTISGYGRPQGLINRDVEQCEYFIGLMWQRWGTPPSLEAGPFTSGFEEEFDLAFKRRAADSKPEISLFFKDIASEFLVDPGPSLKQVLTFRKRMEFEKRILYETFKDERDYLRKLRRCLFAYIQRLRTDDADQLPEQQQDRATSNEPSNQSQSKSDPLFSESGVQFVQKFLEHAQNERRSLTPFDVARFRLFGDIARLPGNDEGILGVHDANVIYLRVEHRILGQDEVGSLADCGLRHFVSQSTPLWRWLTSIEMETFLPISTFIGPSEQCRGALLAMSLIKAPIWLSSAIGRSRYLDRWFALDTHTSVKAAALTYLGVAGIPEDIDWINREIERNDFQTRSNAEEALIEIRLRQGRAEAIDAVLKLQPSDLDDRLTSKIFSKDTSIEPAVLEQLTLQRGKNIRKAAFQIAKCDGLLTTDMANRLLTDTDADIRFDALSFLATSGQSFSETEAKNALVKPNPGILYSNDYEGEKAFEKFQVQRLKQLTAEQLDERVDSSSIYSYLARAERYFDRYGTMLRSDIEDRFTRYFNARTTSDQIKNLSDYLRKKMTRDALDVLCSKMAAQDLALVRRVLGSGFVEYSDADVAYLSRFGDWSDISLLIAMTNRPAFRGASLIMFSPNTMHLVVTKAILSLGRDRLLDILQLEMTISLKERLF